MLRLVDLSALILSSALAIAPLGLQAAIYKWTDEKGQIHFSDQPPSKKPSKTLNVPPPKPNAGTTQNSRLQEQLKAIDSLSKSRKDREKKREEELAEKKQKQKSCSQLKARIKQSESVNTYYRYTEDGEVEYLSDEEGDALRVELKRQYQQNCK